MANGIALWCRTELDPPSVCMYDYKYLIGAAVLLVLAIGPVLLRLKGVGHTGRTPVGASPEPAPVPISATAPAPVSASVPALDWNLSITSALLFALAFNLIFFVQELFLVLPKALTPGLRPILFHNNHTWTGENPLASLFQGTGALAIFITGLGCALLLKRRVGGSSSVRLFLIWMAYNGFLQSLPQVVIGAVEPQNDVGMAMDFLHFGATAKTAAALAALVAIAALALSLRAPLLSVAPHAADIGGGRARSRFMFRVSTLPALAAILLIVPFRVPRNWVEVVAVPTVVTIIGVAWIQAGAWAVVGVQASGRSNSKSTAYALGALLMLLLVFQFALRPGVKFY